MRLLPGRPGVYHTNTHTHLVLRLPVAQKCSGTVGMYKDPAVSGFNWEHLETHSKLQANLSLCENTFLNVISASQADDCHLASLREECVCVNAHCTFLVQYRFTLN